MNVIVMILMHVVRIVLTLMDLTLVIVALDMKWELMIKLVLVSLEIRRL